MIDIDPSIGIRAPKGGEGHRAWSAEELEAFRKKWPFGTEQRLAFELGFWVGCRSSDVVKNGWQHVGPDGWIAFRQTKTGGEVSLPLKSLPDGFEDRLVQDHAHVVSAIEHTRGRMIFMETAHGRPRSSKAMAAWFRSACTAAQLPMSCTFHGLRSTRASILAELGWSASRIGVWTRHTTLKEVTRYTRSASRRRMIEGVVREQKKERVPAPIGNDSHKS
ncbi:MAG: tyrosine-type recombinase/integrase [Devosia sp.]